MNALKKFLTCTFLLILSFQFAFNNTYTAYAFVNSNENIASSLDDISGQEIAYTTKTTTTATAAVAKAYDGPKTFTELKKYLKSDGIALVDAATGKVIYEQNGDKIMYPASTTKIMTALLILENAELDDVVTLGNEIKTVPSDSSFMYPRLVVGEKLTLKDLLYAMMFKSSNDAAEALALYVGGTRANFINMMNQKAKDLGMENTHYVNPHGYQDKDHYTTPLDLARLAIYATQNKTLMNIVSSTTYTIPKTNKSKARAISNVNRLLNKSATEYLAEATGMKTGTTSDAQECLVSSASKDGYSVVCVALKHPVNTNPNRFIESKKLLQYGLYSLENNIASPTETSKVQYVYPTPTPTIELYPTYTQPTASLSVGSFVDKLGDFYNSLGLIAKIVITIILLFLILLILLIFVRKKKQKRRKYRSKYMATKNPQTTTTKRRKRKR